MKLSDLCITNSSFLESRDDYRNARIILLGVPLDITSSFRMGSRDAPQAVRARLPGVGGIQSPVWTGTWGSALSMMPETCSCPWETCKLA